MGVAKMPVNELDNWSIPIPNPDLNSKPTLIH